MIYLNKNADIYELNLPYDLTDSFESLNFGRLVSAAAQMPCPHSTSRLAILNRFSDQEREINSLWCEYNSGTKEQAQLSNVVKNNAIAILNNLPLDVVIPPEIDILPNGQIIFDWHNKNCLFSLIITSNHIDLAVKFCDEHTVVERLRYNKTLPIYIINYLLQVINS